MSLERFVKMFTSVVPDATPEEIADALWLAASSPPCHRAHGDGGLSSVVRAAESRPPSHMPADLVPALSALRREVPSPGTAVLDEHATVERTTRGIRLPVLRPATERWLELALVIDASSSMAIWRDTVRDLRAALESSPVFRQVRVWWLDSDTRTGESFVLRNHELPEQSSEHSPWELLDPTGRRITLVISDCLGAAWRDRRVAKLLERWASTNHVSIVQMFPQRLWRRCAPPVASVQIQALKPAMENRCYGVRYRHMADPGPGFRHQYGEQPSRADGVAIPVLRFDPRWLERWARIVSGSADWADIPVMFTGRVTQPQPDAGAEMSARARVARFRATASHEAYQLAGFLTLAPLTLPAIRLVQQAMLPFSSPSHLAEVLTGGLLVRASESDGAPAANDPPVLYEFHQGVRDLLRSSVQRSAGLAVLRLVTRHVTSRSGRPVDILALLDAPTDEGLIALAQSDWRFAHIARSALRGLGGRYAEVADRLGSQLDPFHIADGGEEPWLAANMSRWPARARADISEVRPVRSGSSPAPPATLLPVVAQSVRGDEVSYPPSDRPGRERRGDMSAIWIGVPPRNPYFTGREDLLRDIHERLTGKVTALVPHALHGHGGVGKTHLAIEYVHRYQSEYNLVCWISAEQPAIVRTTIADLAKRMNLPSLTVDDAVRSVLTALRQNQPYDRWLLVFDNVNMPKDIEDFLPIGSGHIIVTSRSDVWTGVAQVVEVNVFLREESIAFLRSRLPTVLELDADQLAARLEDLPLALEQAAAWQVETRTRADDYLRLFDERLGRLQEMEVVRAGDLRADYPLPVAVTWSLALDKLRESQPEVVLLLQLCAYFAPEPIPWNVLSVGRFVEMLPENLRRALSSNRERDRMIREIKKYALAQVDYGSNRLQLHRLAQLVLREELPGPQARDEVRHQAHMLIAAADPGDPDVPDNWERYRDLWPHVEPSGAVECVHREVREMVLNLTRYLYVQGSYDAGQAFAEMALRRWEQGFQHNDQATLVLVRHLATILRALGKDIEARARSMECYDILRRVYGDDDEEALSAGNLVGGTYRGLGRFSEALNLDRDLFSRHIRVFGDEHPRTLMSQNNLALDYFLIGDYDRAAELDAAVLQARRRVLGDDNPFTLQSEDGYARDLREAGQYQVARNQLENTLSRYVATLGMIHPSTLRAAKQLAIARRKAGDYVEALRLSEQTHTSYQSRLGPTHPDTLSAAGNLVNDLRITGDFDAAATLARETLRQYQQLLGDNHPFTLSAENNYAIVLRQSGRVEDASILSEHALAGFRETLGADHPYTLSAATTHANDLSTQGNKAAATELLEATYASFKQVLGPYHPYTLACAVNLVQDLRATDQEEDASRLADATMDRYAEALGPGHPEAIAGRSLAVRSECSTDAPYT
jgi:tetratricopeptide (TPR) repeat protein